MARPREFDRIDTLNKAMAVFWEKGYAATSTSDLLAAMGIGRQSMYDTFGDKHALYLEALTQYGDSSMRELLHSLQSETALGSIANMLRTFAARPEEQNRLGCMGVNAICEFGDANADVNALREANGALLNEAVERLLRAARDAGEIAADTDIRAAAAYIGSTLFGMKVSAKAGASAATLGQIAAFAIDGLRAR